MSLRLDGFLSQVVDSLPAKALADHPRQAALLEEVNRFAVGLVVQPREFSRDTDQLTALLFARAIQDFEAAIILATRGLRAQSRAMVRSTFETGLYCAAAAHDVILTEGAKLKPRKGTNPTTRFVDAFDGGHQRFRSAIACEMSGFPEIPPEDVAMLVAVVDDLGTLGRHQDIDLKGLAFDLGLSDLFTVVYRPLSQDAHPSTTSLRHHLVEDRTNEKTVHRIGPDFDQLEDTLELALCSFLVAIEAYTNRLGTPKEKEEAKTLLAAYARLFDQPQ